MSEDLQRPPWQFSTREMLLAVTAVAAILAAFIGNRRYSRSVVIDANIESMLSDIYQEMGWRFAIHQVNGHSLTSRRYGSDLRILGISSPSLIEFQNRVVPRLRDAIKSAIAESGGKVTYRLTKLHKELEASNGSFSFDYQIGRRTGRVRVYTIGEGDSQEQSRRPFWLVVDIDEE